MYIIKNNITKYANFKKYFNIAPNWWNCIVLVNFDINSHDKHNNLCLLEVHYVNGIKKLNDYSCSP